MKQSSRGGRRRIKETSSGHSPATAPFLMAARASWAPTFGLRRRWNLHLRFVISASLIAFGSVIGVGALALFLPAGERPRVAGTASPDPPASFCERQAWLNLDRNCLSRRDLPWVAGERTARPVTVEVPPAAEDAPEQPVTERHRIARAPEEEPASDMTAPGRGLPVPPPAAAEQRIAKPAIEPPVAPPAPKKAAAEQHVAKPAIESPVAPPAPKKAAAERHVAKPAIESQVVPAPPKKIARSGRAARRSTNEALKTVRRFGGETLHDIPVSAYAADGTRRSIVIRPTSVQDVYYYSVPR
jgi:hypothetical protein